jgi:UDP:flavonoid glycosyltransferase YjiC (YdhE family)
MRVLFAMFEGGGNLSLILPVVARLVDRGHDVRVLAGPNVRAGRAPMSERFLPRIRATRATPVVLSTPTPHPFDDAHFGWTPRWLDRITPNCPPLLWSRAWAEGVRDELARAGADVVAADFILLGALAGAEAAVVPAAALVHGTWKHRPAPGIPPYGTGFLPSRSLVGRLRAAPFNVLFEWRYRRDGLPPLNAARRSVGLPPLRSPFEQFDRAERVLLLSSAAFDMPPQPLPQNVRYVGAPVERTPDAAWRPPWPAGDPRPLVLVSLSTLHQGQGPVMQRVIEAVGGLPVRALVTLGPSLDRSEFVAPPNTVIEAFVPHDVVMQFAGVMVTQCGLGTLAKAFAVGLPLVCVPILADQPGNAALVVARGAGVRLSPRARSQEIARAIMQVVSEPRFREAAKQLSSQISREDGALNAALELEGLAEPMPADRAATP